MPHYTVKRNEITIIIKLWYTYQLNELVYINLKYNYENCKMRTYTYEEMQPKHYFSMTPEMNFFNFFYPCLSSQKKKFTNA